MEYEQEQIINRVMPHSIEAEQSVIGSMLMANDALIYACENLKPEDFYDRRCQVIFAAAAEIFNEGNVVDPVTLTERLAKKNVPEDMRSVEVLGALLNAVPTSTNIREYVRIVLDKSQMRELIRVCEEAATLGYKDADSPDEILEAAEKNIFALLQGRNSMRQFRSIREVALDTLTSIEKAAAAGGHSDRYCHGI